MRPDRFPWGDVYRRWAWLRHAAGVGLAVGLLVALQRLDSLQGVEFTVSLAVITLCSVVLGAGPGLVATALTGMGIWYRFLPPEDSFWPKDREDLARLVAFFMAATAVHCAVAAIHRTRRGLVLARAQAVRALEAQRRLSDAAHRAAELLRDERDFVATILDTTASLVVVLDAQGTVVRFNRACERATGRRAEEVLGQSYQGFVRPAELGALRELGARLGEATGVVSYENSWSARDGTEHDGAWSVTTVRDDAGRVRYVVASGIDVTERKRAEEALRRSEAAFRQMAEAMPQMVWTTRPDGENDYVNARWIDYTGAEPADATADGWLRFVHPDDAEVVAARWRQSVRTGEPFEVELRLRRLDGSCRWFLSRALPLRDEEGRVTRWLGTCTDIHDQKQAQAELSGEKSRLELADARKNEFLAVLSHEIRNPLSPIRNAVYLLQRTEPGSELAGRALAVIDRQVHQVSRLVDDLLDVTRISRGKIRLRRERMALEEVLRGTAEDLRSLFEAAGVELDVRLGRVPCVVLGDATRLSQVVDNLLINAAKFTPRGGRVSLSLEAADGAARIRVRDTGAGISGEQLQRLFEPFVQDGRTLERSRSGLGLGLALVKGLVELHGGNVSASSDGPGAGAEFVVSLPLADAAGLRPEPGYEPAAPHGLH